MLANPKEEEKSNGNNAVVQISSNIRVNNILQRFLQSNDVMKKSEEAYWEFWNSVVYTLRLYAVLQKIIDRIVFTQKNKEFKDIVVVISDTTYKAREYFVSIFTNIVSFVKQIESQRGLIKTFAKMKKNFQSKLVEKSKVDEIMVFLKKMSDFLFLKSEEFEQQAKSQLLEYSSGHSSLLEDIKIIGEFEQQIEIIENQEIKPRLKKIFDNNYQIKYCEGRINGVREQINSKSFQNDQLKSRIQTINSNLNSVISQKSRTPKQLEDCYVTTKSYQGWFYSSYSREYSYEYRDNIEYTRLDGLESDLKSYSSSATYEISQVSSALSNLETNLGDLKGTISKLSEEINQLNKEIRDKQDKVDVIKKEKKKSEDNLKNVMAGKGKILGYEGSSVMYVVNSLQYIGKIRMGMEGGQLLFKKFANLLMDDFSILKEQLDVIDSENDLESKIELWRYLFESKNDFYF